MDRDFSVRFNRNRQWIYVYLHRVRPVTFYKRNGTWWAWFEPAEIAGGSKRSGLFGELHFVQSRLRFDTIVHELDHVRTEWMWSRGTTITRHNEEKMACFLDELCRKFVRELRKIHPDVKL